MRDFLKECRNLKELSVLNSSLSILDLAEVLSVIENISKLKFSINSPEEFWNAAKFSSQTNQNSWEHLFSSSNLEGCKNSLATLQSLEIYMGQYPLILGTLLRYVQNLFNRPIEVNFLNSCFSSYSACLSLEKLSLNLDMKQDVSKMTRRMKVFDNPALFSSIKSIVLHTCNGHNIDGCMVHYLNELFEKSSHSLECLWVPKSLRYNRFPLMHYPLKNMLTLVCIKILHVLKHLIIKPF